MRLIRLKFKSVLIVIWVLVLSLTAYFWLSPGNSDSKQSSTANFEAQISEKSTNLGSVMVDGNRSNDAPIAEAPPESGVFTYVCNDLRVRPERMQFSCQAGEDFIDQISWSTWSETGAIGNGILNQSSCSFGCDGATYKKYPVSLQLSGPIVEGKRTFFGRLDWTFTSSTGQVFSGVFNPTAVHYGRVIVEDW